jgi:hypothetical protein
VWFATDRGLVRTDGRDWFQFQEAAAGWVHLGRVDRPSDVGLQGWGAWRFVRGANRWEHADRTHPVWSPAAVDLDTTGETAVRSVVWTDAVAVDLLQGWDGERFESAAPADPADLVVRHKPSDDRVLPGGLPACPRIPPGRSTWRYLSIEPDPHPAPPDDQPFWTTEGRLIPPPDGDASIPGRFDEGAPTPVEYGEAVFAYDPAAKVWMTWEASRPLAVLVRIARRSPDEQLDPAVVDRAWEGIQQVRPAGVVMALAVDEDIVRR